MPIDPRIKQLAYKLDPECWKSYSGKPINYKRYMEGRRDRSLALAAKARLRKSPKPRGETVINPIPRPMALTTMPPMKIKMVLHFYGTVGPFAPEEQRRSEAYSQFVRELLHEGMIERPSHAERVAHPGWAYKTTDKGRVYVEAVTRVPLPVAAPPVKTTWVMPLVIASPRRPMGEGSTNNYQRDLVTDARR